FKRNGHLHRPTLVVDLRRRIPDGAPVGVAGHSPNQRLGAQAVGIGLKKIAVAIGVKRVDGDMNLIIGFHRLALNRLQRDYPLRVVVNLRGNIKMVFIVGNPKTRKLGTRDVFVGADLMQSLVGMVVFPECFVVMTIESRIFARARSTYYMDRCPMLLLYLSMTMTHQP